MKKLVNYSGSQFMGLILAMLVSGTALAQTKTLECSNDGMKVEKFSAVLDDSHYDAGSGYFDIKNASYQDNFVHIDLTCTGHDLQGLDCIGFAYGSAGHVQELTLIEKDGGFLAALSTLKGSELEMHNGPWPCQVK